MEFHSIACIGRGGLLGTQGTNVRYVRVNTLVTPPPPVLILYTQNARSVGGIKPTEEIYVREDSREEEAVSHVVGGSLRS